MLVRNAEGVALLGRSLKKFVVGVAAGVIDLDVAAVSGMLDVVSAEKSIV